MKSTPERRRENLHTLLMKKFGLIKDAAAKLDWNHQILRNYLSRTDPLASSVSRFMEIAKVCEMTCEELYKELTK